MSIPHRVALTQPARLGGLLNDGSVWRMSELAAQGISAATVRRAVASGIVEAVARGTYRSASAPHLPGIELAEVCARVPDALVCLHSAAALHELGDMAPSKVWLAIRNDRSASTASWPPTRFIRWRGETRFNVDVEDRVIAGVKLRVTAPARTVVDMLLCSDLVGEDRALDCLRDYVTSGRDALRLSQVAEQVGGREKLRPYLKAASLFAGVR